MADIHVELVTECSLFNALHHKTMDPRLTRKRLKLRKLCHSSPFKILFTGSAFLLLFLLPFLEHPSLDSSPESRYLTQSEETITNKKYFWSSIVIECLLLLVLTVYAILKGFIIMPPYSKTALFTSYRLTYYLYILALLISWPLWLASVIDHNGENDQLLHIRQFVRPVFLIVQVSMIKKILKAIAYTSLQLIGIITLLFLMLFIFVMIGLAIFPHEEITHADIVNEGRTYFNSTKEAFWNLLVYLSTANSPDFKTPAYSHNRAYFLYFVAFFFIASYLLLKVIVALYATRFMFFLKESMKRTYTNRLVNLAVAFQAITRKGSFNENEQIPSHEVKQYAVHKLNLIDEEEFDSLCTEQLLNWDNFKKLFLTIFTSYQPVEDETVAYFLALNRAKLSLFYLYILCHLYINVISLPLAVIHVIVLTTLLVIDHEDSLTDQQSKLVKAMLFFSCLYIIELVARVITLIAENCELYLRTRNLTREQGNQETREPGNQETRELGTREPGIGTRKPGNWEPGNQGTRKPGNQETRELGTREPGNQETRELGTREPGNLRTREPGNQETWEPGNKRTREQGNQGTREPGNKGTWDLDTFCKVMKWLFFGHNLRLHSKAKQSLAILLEVFDILLLLSITFLGFSHYFALNFLPFFTLVQITITLVILRMFRMVARIPTFAIMFFSLFHILIVLIPFVVLAYILYYQFAVIGIALFGHTNLTDTTAVQQYGTYENLDYHSYHFEDFGSTLVLLWNLMIVNNWHIITDAYVRRNSEAARLYFITWWLITETVINGVVFGVMIEILSKTAKEFFELKEKLKNKKFPDKLSLIFNNYIWWGRSDNNHSNIIDSWNVYNVITFDEPEQEKEINDDAIKTVKANSELKNLLKNITTDNNQPFPV